VELISWLIVAAEPQEFRGILKRAPHAKRFAWPHAPFAREVSWPPSKRGMRWLLIATGAGRGAAARSLIEKPPVEAVVNIGFCGALDPALVIGDIVITGDIFRSSGRAFVQGTALCLDRVAVTAAEKRHLRESTGASIIEMESAAVAAKAREWGLPFCAVRAVSDTADEDMPLDFNRYRDAEGRFSRAAITLAALRRPLTAIPGLIRLESNCRRAADSLGEFLADCQF
jgi:adenosylhomocysteine nucleosidase